MPVVSIVIASLFFCHNHSKTESPPVHEISSFNFATEVHRFTNYNDFLDTTIRMQGLFSGTEEDDFYFVYRYAVGCCTPDEEVFGLKVYLNELIAPSEGEWVDVVGILKRNQTIDVPYLSLSSIEVTQEVGFRVVPPLRQG